MSDQQIQQFMTLTNCSADVATQFINKSNGDLEDAINKYYASLLEGKEKKSESEAPLRDYRSNASSSVGNANASHPSSAASGKSVSSTGPKKKETPKFRTISQIVKEAQADDEDDDEARHTFAGGETSGLEVTDPNDSNSLIRDLLDKARRGGERGASGDEEQAPGKKAFSGKGYRLGSSVNAVPEVLEDPEQAVPAKPKKVTREITFWKEGFQVSEDGQLYRYDDPANSYYLNELNRGRAPLKLLNVEFGQEVDVNVYKKLDESYKPPKRKYGGFEGSGRRLGSPIPGDAATVENESARKEPSVDVPVSSEPEKVEEPKGDVSVQIRYANGKREIVRCNSTDTIQFLYDHVKKNTDDPRPFNLNQTHPVKPINQLESTIGEQNLCNSVVVQRWV
ncbi:protein phosphatase regulator SHP1 Ecym_4698 [Eremothecium cymbalariae DBVPG|uniref:UBX domain-containing protein n=1 Tax=Eremothecium cymbalariae (strain CBS 270.75 / DBVPG 7215 / KCTC 17166 / NRRL Y-17582) TaxID=931890 RepID=G8JSJ6_ERECY|nr:hypothetical protein Ecym_4698 [Eremothecium cymbalariae DBVPG\